MEVPEQTTIVLENSVGEFVFEIDALRQDGWEFFPENPPAAFGFLYECHMWRNPTDIQRAQGPKLSRAEILAKARAAKAEKRAQAEAAPATDVSPY